MRDHDGKLTFAPRLPQRLERLTFRLLFRGRRLKVDATKAEAAYVLLEGEPLQIGHHGKTITVSMSEAVTQPIPAPVVRPAPAQPLGRAPARRGKDSD